MQRTSDAKPVSTRTGSSLVRRLRRDCIPMLLAVGGAAVGAQAVELGEMRIHSPAGSQLRASIPLSGTDAAEAEGRCFDGALLNANGQPTGTLRVALQRSAAGPVLLLVGSVPEGGQASTVQVQNTCGTGAQREYRVMLAAAPAALAALAAPAATAQAVSIVAQSETERSAQSKRLQKAQAQEEALSRKLKSLETKLAKVLSTPDARALLQAPVAAAKGGTSAMPADQPLVLKFERSLAIPASSDASPGNAAWTEQEVGALLLLLLAGTGAGLFFNQRKTAAPKQWMPPGMD